MVYKPTGWLKWGLLDYISRRCRLLPGELSALVAKPYLAPDRVSTNHCSAPRFIYLDAALRKAPESFITQSINIRHSTSRGSSPTSPPKPPTLSTGSGASEHKSETVHARCWTLVLPQRAFEVSPSRQRVKTSRQHNPSLLYFGGSPRTSTPRIIFVNQPPIHSQSTTFIGVGGTLISLCNL